MKALILVNGELYRPDIVRSRIRAQTFGLVLAADGGAGFAGILDVTLDAIIGDMDSLSSRERPDTKTELVSHPAEKDETDLELALLYAEAHGADRIVMAGAIGGRFDMTIANVLLLAHPDLGSCEVEVWHGEQTGWVIKPQGGDISGHPGDTVSLIPLGGDARGITTKGLKHSLTDAQLAFGPARGISNLLEEPAARVDLSEGLLLAVHTPGRA